MVVDSAGPIDPATQFYSSTSPLALECGSALSTVTIAYRTWGTLNAARNNVVLVCHALTGSADADDWWPGLIGQDCPLDPARDFIVCSNVIGGCYGSTGPYSSSRANSTGRRGLDFPLVTIRDMVNAQKMLLESLNVSQIALAIGPSLGGMQVLEWAASYPDFVQAIAPIGVSGRHSAWATGIGEAQRAAIRTDPNWCDGMYSDTARPAAGLATARMMAMVTYRSWQNFEVRFNRSVDQADDFSVSSYLNYQGEKLVRRFDASSYYRLTQAMDSHDVGRSRGGTDAVLKQLDIPALIVSVSSDVLYPPVEQAYLAKHLPQSTFEELTSDHGHDGFLIDLAPLCDMIVRFRERTNNVQS